MGSPESILLGNVFALFQACASSKPRNEVSRLRAQAEYNVGTILQDRFKKDRVFSWVILQVRVLNDDHVARSCLETSTQRCSLPEIAFLQNDLVDPPVRFPLRTSLVPSIDPAFHEDNFHAFDRRRANCFNHSFNWRLLIVTRDKYRQLHSAFPPSETRSLRSEQLHPFSMS